MTRATDDIEAARRALFRLAKRLDILTTCDDNLMSRLEAAYRSGDLAQITDAAMGALAMTYGRE